MKPAVISGKGCERKQEGNIQGVQPREEEVKVIRLKNVKDQGPRSASWSAVQSGPNGTKGGELRDGTSRWSLIDPGFFLKG